VDPTTFFFYVFAAVTIFAALRVVTARHPVHSALYLVLSFFSAAGIWLLLKAEFLAITLVLVYVGAVMVLFLFVVMMLDVDIDRMRKGFWGHLPVAGLVGGLIVVELGMILWHQFSGFAIADAPLVPTDISNTQALGAVLYTDYVLPFQIAAVLLLVAIVAAIALTLRRREGVKSQNVSDQVRVRAGDRVRLVDMPRTPARPQQEQQP
jgi:NADH-quinone oxidoreductase subunit J